MRAAPIGVTLTTAGQNAEVTFVATAGQQVSVRMTGNTVGTLTLQLLRPDRTILATAYPSLTSYTLATQTWLTPGLYTIRVDPMGARIGSVSLQVTTP
jgi:hypothetical protein